MKLITIAIITIIICCSCNERPHNHPPPTKWTIEVTYVDGAKDTIIDEAFTSPSLDIHEGKSVLSFNWTHMIAYNVRSFKILKKQ